MNCDEGPVNAFLNTAIFFIITAAVSAIASAVANAFPVFLYAAPGFMLGCAGSTAIALGLIGFGRTKVGEFIQCMVGTGRLTAACQQAVTNVRNNFTALTTTLSIQLVAATSLAVQAWIPWLPQVQMWALVGALFASVALVISLIAFWNSLKSCLRGMQGQGI